MSSRPAIGKVLVSIVVIIIVAVAAGGAYFLLFQPAPSGTTTNVTYTSCCNPTQFTMPQYVAQNQKFYAKNNLNVTWVQVANGAADLQALVAGKTDFALMPSLVEAQAMAAGAPATVIAAAYWGLNYAVLYRTSTGIHTLADLKGKTIGISSFSSATAIMLIAALNKSGIPTSAVNLVPLSSQNALVAALIQNKVDVIDWDDGIVPTLVHDNLSIGYQETTPYVFPNGYLSQVLVVSNNFMQTNPIAVKSFLRAWFQAVNYMSNNRNQIIQIGMGAPFSFSQAVAQRYFDTPYTYASSSTNSTHLTYSSNGQFTIADLQNTVDLAVAYKVIPSAPTLASSVNLSFVPVNVS